MLVKWAPGRNEINLRECWMDWRSASTVKWNYNVDILAAMSTCLRVDSDNIHNEAWKMNEALKPFSNTFLLNIISGLICDDNFFIEIFFLGPDKRWVRIGSSSSLLRNQRQATAWINEDPRCPTHIFVTRSLWINFENLNALNLGNIVPGIYLTA